MRLSGVYEEDRLERFSAMPRDRRLGDLASTLARIATYSKNRRSIPAIYETTREARHFLGICAASEADRTQSMEVDDLLDSALRTLREKHYPNDGEVSRILE